MFDCLSCCRLCLKVNVENSIDCLKTVGLMDAIKNVFGFTISSKDNCSTKICKGCSYSVTSFSLYKDTVLRNQKSLAQYVEFQMQGGSTSQLEPTKNIEIRDDSDEDLIIIEPPDTSTRNNSSLNNDHESKDSVSECRSRKKRRLINSPENKTKNNLKDETCVDLNDETHETKPKPNEQANERLTQSNVAETSSKEISNKNNTTQSVCGRKIAKLSTLNTSKPGQTTLTEQETDCAKSMHSFNNAQVDKATIDLKDSTNLQNFHHFTVDAKLPILSGVYSLTSDCPISQLIECKMEPSQQFAMSQISQRKQKFKITLRKIHNRLRIEITDTFNHEILFNKLTMSGRQTVMQTLSEPPHSVLLQKAMRINDLDEYSKELLDFVGLSCLLNS